MKSESCDPVRFCIQKEDILINHVQIIVPPTTHKIYVYALLKE